MSLLVSIIDLHNLFKILTFRVEKRIKQFSALGFLFFFAQAIYESVLYVVDLPERYLFCDSAYLSCDSAN